MLVWLAMTLRCGFAVEAGSQDQDRVAVIPVLGDHVLVLADGAGGRAGGREAAEALVRFVRAAARALVEGERDPCEVLTSADAALAAEPRAGETTAVVAVVSGAEVRGASVGDSGAWQVSGDGVRDLTRAQVRKPLLGSGAATPVAFGPVPLVGRLLLASDGLLKYAPPERIERAALTLPPDRAAWDLIETVRYPSGGLPDDVAVILCELGG
ncbi:MAG: protein phosphatase 2C domain-containing protein [Planctomycetota bacterium]